MVCIILEGYASVLGRVVLLSGVILLGSVGLS